jgi:histone deacetylase complex subunit SAP30
MSPFHQLTLSQAGSTGLHSPTMARRKADRKQSREQLATVVRKHFNGVGIQENDVVVDFIHKVRSQGISKPGRK